MRLLLKATAVQRFAKAEQLMLLPLLPSHKNPAVLRHQRIDTPPPVLHVVAPAPPPPPPPPPPAAPEVPPPSPPPDDDDAPPPPEPPRELYEIPETHLPALRQRIEKLAKRAAKLGVDPATIEVFGEPFLKTYPRYDEQGVKVSEHKLKTFHVRIVGAAPKLPGGWQFRAVIQHLEQSNVLRILPGVANETIPRRYWDVAPTCDHCALDRDRRDTYLLQNEAGEWKQVGRSCLKDFVGSQSPANIAGMAEHLALLRSMLDGEFAVGDEHRGHIHHDLDDTLAATARMIEGQGWVSRSRALPNQTPTADEVWDALTPGNEQTRRQSAAFAATITDADRKLAADVIAWVEGGFGHERAWSDYELNLHSAFRPGVVSQRMIGLIASAVPSFRRFHEQHQRVQHEAAVSEHFGTVKKREQFTLTLLGVSSVEGIYGTTYVHRFADPAGNQAVWFGSVRLAREVHPGEGSQTKEPTPGNPNPMRWLHPNPRDPSGKTVFYGGYEPVEPGTTIAVDATVKSHGEFRGAKQTVLSRVSPVHVHWLLHADGRMEPEPPPPKPPRKKKPIAKATGDEPVGVIDAYVPEGYEAELLAKAEQLMLLPLLPSQKNPAVLRHQRTQAEVSWRRPGTPLNAPPPGFKAAQHWIETDLAPYARPWAMKVLANRTVGLGHDVFTPKNVHTIDMMVRPRGLSTALAEKIKGTIDGMLRDAALAHDAQLTEQSNPSSVAPSSVSPPSTFVVCPHCRPPADHVHVYGRAPGTRARIPAHKNEVGGQCRGEGGTAIVEAPPPPPVGLPTRPPLSPEEDDDADMGEFEQDEPIAPEELEKQRRRELWQERERQRAARTARLTAAVSNAAKKPVELQTADGETVYVVSKIPRADGGYRITRFQKIGPIGHTEHDALEGRNGVVEELQYERELTPVHGVIDQWALTPEWAAGMEHIRRIQEANERSWTGGVVSKARLANVVEDMTKAVGLEDFLGALMKAEQLGFSFTPPARRQIGNPNVAGAAAPPVGQIGKKTVGRREVQRPGIHGGTYWTDEHGHVRYDERPSQDAQHVVTPAAALAHAEQIKAEKAATVGDPKRAAKFRAAADRMQASIDADYNPGVSRQNLTRRRAGIAGQMFDRAQLNEKLQSALRHLADHHEAGTVPPLLAGIASQSDLWELWRQNTFRGEAYLHNSELRGLLTALGEHPEVQLPRGTRFRLEAIFDAGDPRPDKDYFRGPLSDDDVDMVRTAIKQVGGLPDKYGHPNHVNAGMLEHVQERDRFRRLGITSQADLDTARELVRGLAGPQQVDPHAKVKQLERNLLGSKYAGYFPTPRALGDRVVALADIRAGMSVLEPSAGKGDLVEAIQAAAPAATVDAIELVPQLAEILEAKGIHVVGNDMFAQREGQYDRIVMNPPFEGMADIDHVRHAYERLLKPGGRLVAIMGEGPFFRSDQKAADFRAWLDAAGADIEQNAEGAFSKNPSTDRITGVASRTVVIDKPAEKPAAPAVPPVAYSERGFPLGPDGEELSWNLGSYHTSAEQMAGFPRMRLVIRAMQERRPEQLATERRELQRGSLDRVFGGTARTALAVIDEFAKARTPPKAPGSRGGRGYFTASGWRYGEPPAGVQGVEKHFQAKVPGLDLQLSTHGGTDAITEDAYGRRIVTLDHIEVAEKKRGTGTAVMEDLVRWADREGVTLTLSVADRNDRLGTTSAARLHRFYRRFGFVDNKGRRKDYSLSLYTNMYRTPAGPIAKAVRYVRRLLLKATQLSFLPLIPSKKNPRVRRRQRLDVPIPTTLAPDAPTVDAPGSQNRGGDVRAAGRLKVQLREQSTILFRGARVEDVSDVADAFRAITGRDRERLWAVSMDADGTILAIECVSIGTIDMSIAHPRESFKTPLVLGAKRVCFVHNHPSGNPTPSAADETMVTTMTMVARSLDLAIESIVVGTNGWSQVRNYARASAPGASQVIPWRKGPAPTVAPREAEVYQTREHDPPAPNVLPINSPATLAAAARGFVHENAAIAVALLLDTGNNILAAPVLRAGGTLEPKDAADLFRLATLHNASAIAIAAGKDGPRWHQSVGKFVGPVKEALGMTGIRLLDFIQIKPDGQYSKLPDEQANQANVMPRAAELATREAVILKALIEADEDGEKDSLSAEECLTQLVAIRIAQAKEQKSVQELQPATFLAGSTILKAHALDGERAVDGLSIAIETDAGETRTWKNHDGTEGHRVMTNPYGYVRRSLGTDGDHLDCFLGPLATTETIKGTTVYVVTINKPPDFAHVDEQKCMLGWRSLGAARRAFLRAYGGEERFIRQIDALGWEDFKAQALSTRAEGGSFVRGAVVMAKARRPWRRLLLKTQGEFSFLPLVASKKNPRVRRRTQLAPPPLAAPAAPVAPPERRLTIPVTGVTKVTVGPPALPGDAWEGHVAPGAIGYRGISDLAELTAGEGGAWQSTGAYTVRAYEGRTTQFAADPHPLAAMPGREPTGAVIPGTRMYRYVVEADLGGLPFRTLREPQGGTVGADLGLGLGIHGPIPHARIRRIRAVNADGTIGEEIPWSGGPPPPFTIDEAERMGRDAYDKGIQASAQDPAFMPRLAHRTPGSSVLPLLEAWNRAWQRRHHEITDPLARAALESPDPPPVEPPPPPPPPPVATRPLEAKRYDVAGEMTPLPYEVLEHDYVAHGVQSAIAGAHRNVAGFEKQAADLAGGKPGSKRENDHHTALSGARYWREQAAKLEGGDTEREQTRLRASYAKAVKEAISKGKPVPQSVIDQRPEFRQGVKRRMSYEKGRHTSFGNESIAIDRSTVATRGFKTKRQDGTPITEAEIAEIASGVDDVEAVLGPIKDIMGRLGLTIAHTRGKHPYLSGYAGLYQVQERTISTGVRNHYINQKNIPSLAHELAHFLDYEAGRLRGVAVRVLRGERSVVSSSLANFDHRNYSDELVREASRSMVNTMRIKKLMGTPLAKAKNDEERGEIEHVRVALGPYWRQPDEIFARLTEQYIGTKLGRGGWGQDAPEKYAVTPGYWTTEQFAKFMPALEQRIQQRLTYLRDAEGTVAGMEAEKALFKNTTRPLAVGEEVRVEEDGVRQKWYVAEIADAQGYVRLVREPGSAATRFDVGSMTARRAGVFAR